MIWIHKSTPQFLLVCSHAELTVCLFFPQKSAARRTTMQFSKSWALKKLPRSWVWLRRCWRRSEAVSLSLIRSNLHMRKNMEQRSVSFKSVFHSPTRWCAAGMGWAALDVLLSPWGGPAGTRQAPTSVLKMLLLPNACPKSLLAIAAPMAAWAENVCACILKHFSNSCLGRFMPGLELLVWTSSSPPPSSAIRTVNSSREKITAGMGKSGSLILTDWWTWVRAPVQ